jgi:hypothetical protein
MMMQSGYSMNFKDIKKDNFIIGDDGDKEWLCPHGVGHGENVHTCDGCCTNTCLECLGKGYHICFACKGTGKKYKE